jgi:hypothetical protein
LKFRAVDSLIASNGTFSLIEKKEKEREGEKEKPPGRLSLAHKVYNKVGPTVRDATCIHQVHAFFSL